MVARLEALGGEVARACRASRARRSRPRRRGARPRRRGWAASWISVVPGLLGDSFCAASASLTSAARALVRASSSAFSSPCAFAICLPSSSARRAWPRRSRSRHGGRRRPRARRRRSRRTDPASPGQRAHGRVRLAGCGDRSCGQGYRGAVVHLTRILAWRVPGASALSRPGHTDPVLDRPRVVHLTWALLCVALFSGIALAAVSGVGAGGRARRPRRPRAAVGGGHALAAGPAAGGRGASSAPIGMTVLTVGARGHDGPARGTGARRTSPSS